MKFLAIPENWASSHQLSGRSLGVKDDPAGGTNDGGGGGGGAAAGYESLHDVARRHLPGKTSFRLIDTFWFNQYIQSFLDRHYHLSIENTSIFLQYATFD